MKIGTYSCVYVWVHVRVFMFVNIGISVLLLLYIIAYLIKSPWYMEYVCEDDTRLFYTLSFVAKFLWTLIKAGFIFKRIQILLIWNYNVSLQTGSIDWSLFSCTNIPCICIYILNSMKRIGMFYSFWILGKVNVKLHTSNYFFLRVFKFIQFNRLVCII